MTTVAQALQKLALDLALDTDQKEEIAGKHALVHQRLGDALGGVETTFLSGALGRGTAIKPPPFTDLFVVLDPATHGRYQAEAPLACLHAVRDALAAVRAEDEVAPRLRGGSIYVMFPATRTGFTLVPSFRAASGVYTVPHRTSARWIEVSPTGRDDAYTAANARTGGALGDLIKLAKYWNQQNYELLNPLHLEVMAYDAFASPPDSLPDALQALFTFLSERVLVACPDPAGIGADIDEGTTEEARAALRTRLLDAADRAAAALDLDRNGHTDEAHHAFRALLGPAYPERKIA